MNWIFSSYVSNNIDIELYNLKKLSFNDNDNIIITNKQIILKRQIDFFLNNKFNYYYFQRYDKSKSLKFKKDIYHGNNDYVNIKYNKHYYLKYENDITESYVLINNRLEKTKDLNFSINIDSYPSTGFICFRYCQELLKGDINLINFTGVGNSWSPHKLKKELEIMSKYCNIYSI